MGHPQQSSTRKRWPARRRSLLACQAHAIETVIFFLAVVHVSSLESTSSFSIFVCKEMSKPSRWHTSEPELLIGGRRSK